MDDEWESSLVHAFRSESMDFGTDWVGGLGWRDVGTVLSNITTNAMHGLCLRLAADLTWDGYGMGVPTSHGMGMGMVCWMGGMQDVKSL